MIISKSNDFKSPPYILNNIQNPTDLWQVPKFSQSENLTGLPFKSSLEVYKQDEECVPSINMYRAYCGPGLPARIHSPITIRHHTNCTHRVKAGL